MWCAAEMNDELPSVASLAKAYCSEAYFHATAENIQIHGGIGFTWEHPAHLYFKRAKSSELLFGDPTYHRELLAQRIGIIHKGHLIQELNAHELERNRRRRLILRARDVSAAYQTLISAGRQAQVLNDGAIEVKNPVSVERPDEVASLLVHAGTPPTQLVVEEEELEEYFLRLVGSKGGVQHA
jgi:hypothetical protein